MLAQRLRARVRPGTPVERIHREDHQALPRHAFVQGHGRTRVVRHFEAHGGPGVAGIPWRVEENRGEPWLPRIRQGGVRGVRNEACGGISCRIRSWAGLSAVTGRIPPLYAEQGS